MSWKRLMVVSRGLKLLRPMLRFPEPVLMTASGVSTLASPGSLSRATWKRNSLTTRVVSTEESWPLKVSLLTTLSPECSSAESGPLFSLFCPVNPWWL